MVNYPNYLSGSQDDINKRLLQMILELQKGDSGENAKIAALEEAVGDKDSGLVKAVADPKCLLCLFSKILLCDCSYHIMPHRAPCEDWKAAEHHCE